jgi:hypothetical protein
MNALRAFGTLHNQTGRPVGTDEVAQIIDMSPYSVNLTTPFFVANQLLEKSGGARFEPAAEVRAFARAHQWNPPTAARELAPVLADSWFAQELIPRLQFETTVTTDRAVQWLAMKAHATTRYVGQVRLLLDFLDAVGLVALDGNHFRSAAPTEPPQPNGEQDEVVEENEQSDAVSILKSTSRYEPRVQARPALHHPLIQGLIEELPAPGSEWTQEERDNWLELAQVALRFVYRIVEREPPIPANERGESDS